LQPELQYATLGSNDGSQADTSVRFSQIILPLRLTYYPTFNGNDDGLFVGLGPQIGFTLLDLLEIPPDRLDFGETVRSLGGDFEAVDFSGTFNLGYEFDFGLWLEATAFHSIFPVWESANGDQNFNGAVSFTAGANLSTIFDNY